VSLDIEWFVSLSARLATLSIVETQASTIESAFQDFTERKDIAILLINQHVRVCTSSVESSGHALTLPLTSQLCLHSQIAEKIRSTVDKYTQAFPALLEIPSKDHPYGRLAWSLLSPCNTYRCICRPIQGFNIEARTEVIWRVTFA
jgi:vacuolar-type H+-ATPase subunit F/Vma7